MAQSRIPLALLLALLIGVFVAVVQQSESPDGEGRGVTKLGGRAADRTAAEAFSGGVSDAGAAPRRESKIFAGRPTVGNLPESEEGEQLSPAELDARKQAALDEVLASIDANPNLTREQGDELARYAGQLATEGTPRVQCWSLETPPALVQAYLMAEKKIAAAGGFEVQALRVANHWARTATNGNNQNAQGLPVTLTWSIVPDGTPITSSGGNDSSDPSSLRARMAVLYGGEAAGVPSAQPWFPIFQAVFDNIAAVSGLRFVYEPADDGTTINGISGSTGTLGVRGDIRLSGHSIDGNSNVLAYAYYPDNGDVVIDTNDNYLSNTSGNSIRLRNIVEHEIGHALGLAHVCPVNQSKLMEPYINLGFLGCQFDDIYSHQRNYGDMLEVHDGVRNNDTAVNATPLALTSGTQSSWQWLSIDDNSDVDLFSFSATDTQQLTVRIIPSDPIQPGNPANNTYLEGPQSGSTCEGTAFDPTNQQDLVLDLLGVNGTTVVASAPVQAAGIMESITTYRFPVSGTHYIRVRGGSNDRAQLYRMEAMLEMAPPLPEIVMTSKRLDGESNSGENGAPDPGETIRLGITLANVGNLAASNLTATISGPAGTTIFDGVENLGTLAIGASNEGLFTFALGGSIGQTIPLQLTVSATGYTAVLPFSVTLGTGVGPPPLDEHFDSSLSLPAGWSQSVSGAGSPWVVSTTRFSSGPNSMFSPSVSPNGEALLVSPLMTVGQGGGQLEFAHQFLLEAARDGGVLEAARNGGEWFDLLNSAATVLAGDYSGAINQSSSSALHGREVWTGSVASFITTRVKLPAAWAGESIVFRWRLVHNSSTTVTGWNVDDVKYVPMPVADSFRPHLSLTTSGASLSETTPGSTVTLKLSTPLPLAEDVTVELEVSGTASATDLSGPLTMTLPAGQTSVTAEVGAVLDSLVEGTESLVFSIPPADTHFAATAPSAVMLDIDDAPVVDAVVHLAGLVTTYDGAGKSASVTTDPGGLAVAVTYNGSAVLPVNAGSYAVSATVTAPGYVGSASGTLVIVSAYVTWMGSYAGPEDPLAAATADLDGDGWDNAGEYLFGTLPNDPGSRPQLQPVLTPETMKLLLPAAPPGISRHVETSTDLEGWSQQGVTPIPGGYEVPRGGAQRFLRVVYEVVN